MARPGTSAPRSPRFPSSKFSLPRSVPRLVHRARLVDGLQRGQQARLTLVVGSPGAGKTMLLADWLEAHPERPSAWLTCDVADANPVRFVSAIVEALRRASALPSLGEDARQLLSLDGEVSADVIAALADDLERSDGVGLLIIDDFHLTGPEGARALALLLEYRPPSLQLVVATRVDPQLRLHRMRANEELIELRDRDLSFSADETREFLSGFGVELDEGNLALVHRKSEGWVAGLQMAALSIQYSPDPAGAAGRVELQRHTVAGYFLDEVLYRQPQEVIDFMLATSILEELSAAACTALYGDGSADLLELVFTGHMFVTMVDDKAGTYRYHHLIKEVLKAELHARHPGRERQLHDTAARYLLDLGQVGPAARHLLAAGQETAAFRLLSERSIRDFFVNPMIGSALDLDEVQPDVFAGAPAILVPLAIELLIRGAFERGARAFALAQEAAVDPVQQPQLALQLAHVRSVYFGLIGELEESLANRDWVRNSRIPMDGLDGWLAGLEVVALYCHTYLGDYGEGRRLADAIASAQVSPPVTEVLCRGVKSQVALAEGGLVEARALADEALDSARRLGFEGHYFAFSALRTAALLALEHHDLIAAADLNERILATLVGGRPIFEYLAQLDRARIWAAGGNFEAALSSLAPARVALRSADSILLARADELEARFRLALGDHHGARTVAGRLPDDRRMIVAATVALASGQPADATALLSPAPTGGLTIRVDLEVRLLQAAVAVAQQSSHAPRLVRETLAIADSHGFIQTLLDTSPQLVDHLISNSARYPRTESLVAVIAARIETRRLAVIQPSQVKLPDPLTDAEIRVLQTLPLRLTYADMASELHLSLNTVKTHLRHTYMKLGVTSRSAAVQRADTLGLF
jgi:LuxR family maltose regulon positive regulatory protein